MIAFVTWVGWFSLAFSMLCLGHAAWFCGRDAVRRWRRRRAFRRVLREAGWR